MEQLETRICIGFDLGLNSVGAAALLLDADEMPVALLNAMVVLHDSGKDAVASGQTSSVSRKASGGAARRARKLQRERGKRRARLHRELEQRGYPIVPEGEFDAYAQWKARRDLLEGTVVDDDQRRRLISLAITHMFNHRGWANSWVPLKVYLWSDEPSKEFQAAVAAYAKSALISDEAADEIEFQTDLVFAGWDGESQLEVRTRDRSANKARGRSAHFREGRIGTQRRVDVVREWREICYVQGIDDAEFEALANIAFGQAKPGVPAENVGKDWLTEYRDQPRAPKASMEHQEFHVRQTVANLRILTAPRSSDARPLSLEEQGSVVEFLLAQTDSSKRPTWQTVAEQVLLIDARQLRTSDLDGRVSSSAPANSAVLAIHGLPSKHPVLQWWREASSVARSAFVMYVADASSTSVGEDWEQEFGALYESLTDAELDKVVKLKLPSDRSAHCLQALRRLNEEMARTGDDYVTVRTRLFGDARPHAISLDTRADHPTLQRILPVVRRFIAGVEQRYDQSIHRVTIEHVRDALLGFQALEESKSRQRRNERDRAQVADQYREAASVVGRVTTDQIRKLQAIQQQGCACLYCGATIAVGGAVEMDHIVPVQQGGNSRRANLVAVCRTCNAAKGSNLFADFAASGKRPQVTMDGALARVDGLQRGSLDARSFFQFRAELKRRLQQTGASEAIDERSLESTAYAATDMRNRIMESLDLPAQRVPVYSGRVVSMARHASGIDKAIQIREGIDRKSRFDRRHHAVDAVVMALLNPSVARTLAERDALRQAEMMSGQRNEWREYEGSGDAARAKFALWKRAMQRMAELLTEALERDEVVVTQPIRVSASHSALHEEGRAPHARKALGAAWTPEERSRVVDDRVYSELSTGIDVGDALAEEPGRTLRLPGGRMLDAEGHVYLFPDGKARHPLPNGSSAPLGSTLHHVRLFRWNDARGRRQAGVVRLFASDLYDLEHGVTDDLLTDPLRLNCRAVRRTSIALQRALHAGAEHVGTFVKGDEVLIEPREWQPDVAKPTNMAVFLEQFPERHWQIAGWEEGKVNLRPFYVAREGAILESAVGASGEVDSRLVVVSDTELNVLVRSARPTASWLWTTPSTLIVRRTGLGVPRLSSNGLPTTWSPYRAVFGD